MLKKIAYLPVLLLWVILAPLFKKLNKIYKIKTWSYRGIFLIDTNQDIEILIEDEIEGTKALLRLYKNVVIGKKYVHIVTKDEEGIETNINVDFEKVNIKK